ncbi:hypothetical protein BKA82DRAFT_4015421 [Pisolithus tinctorius]|nr:hypothetical protein BKA82DRAFT_4015421 [Pisolithus tinctorius]
MADLVGCLLTGPACTVLVSAMTGCLVGCLLTGSTYAMLVCAMAACYSDCKRFHGMLTPSLLTYFLAILMVVIHQDANITTEGNFKAPSHEVTTFSIAEHGISSTKIDVIPLAVKEYKSSGLKATIHQAVKSAVLQHSHDLQDLLSPML